MRAGRAGGRHEERLPGLALFGERIGLAFQLLDDVLDVTGPPERTGKPRGADLLDGTVTLPLILARERDRSWRALDLRSVRTPEQAAEVCARIAETGALEDTRGRALELVAGAKAELPDLPARQRGGAGADRRRRGRALLREGPRSAARRVTTRSPRGG